MNSKDLVKKYWFLTRPGDAVEGGFYMPGENPYQQRGIECGDGWLGILDELFGKIAEVVKRDRLLSFEIRQIKEKFGGLRVYVAGANDAIYELIREAEVKASETCENCGKPGKLIRSGWMATRCDACEARRKREATEGDDDDDERGQRIGGDDDDNK